MSAGLSALILAVIVSLVIGQEVVEEITEVISVADGVDLSEESFVETKEFKVQIAWLTGTTNLTCSRP